MSPLGHTAYLDQSTIIKEVSSSQGSYGVNDLWPIDYPWGLHFSVDISILYSETAHYDYS